jgi:hypothetical protein
MRCLFRSLFTFACLPVAVSAVTLTMSPGQTARAADPSTFPAPTGDRAVLPPDSRLELLFDGACALTEGVAVAPDGMVYFSDITPTSRCKDEKKLYPQAGRGALSVVAHHRPARWTVLDSRRASNGPGIPEIRAGANVKNPRSFSMPRAQYGTTGVVRPLNLVLVVMRKSW